MNLCINGNEKTQLPLPLDDAEVPAPPANRSKPLAATDFSEADRVRFWSKVDKRPNDKSCWIWLGGKNRRGYGGFWRAPQWIHAHRVSYAIHRGETPAGLFVCHTCDTRACINPAHLYLGTAQQNTDDMIAKGRAKHPGNGDGESNPAAKLTDNSVRAIREEYARGGTSYSLLAVQYHVSENAIAQIIKRLKWKRVL